jgi:heme ABC exporter ATP-binding subunit CcmA
MTTPVPADERPIIEIVDLVKTFGLLPVLKQINLTVKRGEFVALLGPNGSGKSTLLRLLAGLGRPTAGVIRVGGWELPHEAGAVRHHIGMVSHKAYLYENLTAYENLKFFAKLYRIPEQDAQIWAMLEQVGLKRRAHDMVRTFSRGMLQRLSIARALLHQPDVLLFDEPYTGLDQAASYTLDQLLLDSLDGRHTIIMTTHELDRAARLAKRAVILSRGRVGLDALTAEIDDLPATYSRVTEMAMN